MQIKLRHLNGSKSRTKDLYNVRLAIITIVSVSLLISGAQGDIPQNYIEALNDASYKDVLTAKNYDTGATLTEEYADLEHLERKTEVYTWGGDAASLTSSSEGSLKGYDADSSSAIRDSSGIRDSIGSNRSGGGLQASINSNVIGKAHIAWQSYDPDSNAKGRHSLSGRSVEDLTGVFSIEKFIQLWSESSLGEVCIDWLPCY